MVHITTPAEEFGPFSPILPVPVDVPTGWECPRCQRIYSPQTRQCVPCSPPPQPFTGPLPRRRESYTFGGFPVTPREPGPMCKCSPVPAGTPADAETSPAPALILPAYMASEFARQISLVGAVDWAEVFPGLQCRLRGINGAAADLEFRLTPPDGQEHD